MSWRNYLTAAAVLLVGFTASSLFPHILVWEELINGTLYEERSLCSSLFLRYARAVQATLSPVTLVGSSTSQLIKSYLFCSPLCLLLFSGLYVSTASMPYVKLD